MTVTTFFAAIIALLGVFTFITLGLAFVAAVIFTVYHFLENFFDKRNSQKEQSLSDIQFERSMKVLSSFEYEDYEDLVFYLENILSSFDSLTGQQIFLLFNEAEKALNK